MGVLALILGIVGVVLPVLPTTPFMIVAAAAFARSSAKFYNMVMSNRVFGPLVFRWRETHTIPKRVKVIAISLITLTIGSSAIFVVSDPWIRGLLVLCGVTLIIWMLRIPSEPASPITP